MKLRALTSTFLIFSLASTLAVSMIVCMPFRVMVTQADLIVVATVTDVRPRSVGTYFATLSIQETWSGASTPEVTIIGSSTRVSAGEHGLYLLNRATDDGAFSIACAGHGRYFIRFAGASRRVEGVPGPSCGPLAGRTTETRPACELEVVRTQVEELLRLSN